MQIHKKECLFNEENWAGTVPDEITDDDADDNLVEDIRNYLHRHNPRSTEALNGDDSNTDDDGEDALLDDMINFNLARQPNPRYFCLLYSNYFYIFDCDFYPE